MNTHFETPSNLSSDQLSFTLTSGEILRPDGHFAVGDLHFDGGVITTDASARDLQLDVSGCLVVPGIVDAHGDGFEHHMMPRVGTEFPDWVALRNVDRELLANGITTAFLAQSYSWEGGMRGVPAARALIDGLRALHPEPSADIRIQIRFETFFLDGVDQLQTWLEDGSIRYVIFNNHVPEYQKLVNDPEHISRWAGSVGLTVDEFRDLLEQTALKGVGVVDAIARLANTMVRLGVPFGSHDDPDPATRQQYNALGGHIAEFPLSVEAARAARELGNPILMGAPNALRGKSASGNVSARELIDLGLCDALVSDYYYPALLHAPFELVRDGVTDLAQAWHLVSTGPAATLGLDDRGSLAAGKRADVTVLRQDAQGRPHVVATFVAGQPCFLDRSLGGTTLNALQSQKA